MANADETTKEKDFMPYSYGNLALDIDIKSYLIDGNERDKDNIQHLEKLIDLDGEKSVENVELEGKIELNEPIQENYLPEEDNVEESLKLVIAVRNPRTFLRELIVVEEAFSGESADFSIDLQSSQSRGKTYLTPYLILKNSIEPQEGFAMKKSERVAEGRRWTLRFDSYEGVRNDYLPSQIKDFTEIGRETVDNDNVFYLDFSDIENPELILNQNHQEVIDILKHEGSATIKARIRDSIYDTVTLPVAHQLALKSISDLDKKGDVRHDWQESFLDEVVKEMYPNMNSLGAKKKLYRLFDEENYTEIMHRLNMGLQRSYRMKKNMTNLITEGVD